MTDLVTIEDTTDPTCGCGHPREHHGRGGCYSQQVGLYCVCTLTIAEVDLANIERIVRREIIAELLGAADEWDALEAKGYDPLSPAEIAGNLRARVQVIRNG